MLPTHKKSFMIIMLGLAAGLILLACDLFPETGLILKEYDYADSDFLKEYTWCSLTLKNKAGEFVIGRDLEDFRVTEAIISREDGTVKAESSVAIAAQAQELWSEAGFWERTVTDEKLDIVLLVDETDSIEDFTPDILSEAQKFVDRLVERHVDFRIASIGFNELVGSIQVTEFRGPMELDELREDLTDIIYKLNGGEWWDPTTAYDALLFTPWLGFRPEARKICVVITDIVPQSIYGTYWYIYDCTAATRSAVEIFLEDQQIELYFSQCPGCNQDVIDAYTVDYANPRASDNESGFFALEDAVNIGWPFSQEKLLAALQEDDGQFASRVVDSRYYLAWYASFDWYETVEDLVYYPEKYQLQITVTTEDPDNAGEQLSTSFTLPLEKAEAALTLNMTDEAGSINDDIWAYIYHRVGDRKTSFMWQLGPENGRILIEDMPVGTYWLQIQDGGSWGYEYENFRVIYRQPLEVTAEGLTLNITVPTADTAAELAKARGLLKDIDDWRVSGDPFREFAEDSRQWLDRLEQDGISWQDMVRIKRFYIALSGYANIIEYAQLESLGAIEDFGRIVQDFRDIVEQVDKLHDTTKTSWEGALDALTALIDIFFTKGEFTIQKEALEQALKKLIEYASGELQQQLKKYVIDQFPQGEGYTQLLVTIVETCIDAQFGGGTEPDWSAVLEAVKKLALDTALYEAQDLLEDNFLDLLFRDSLLEAPLKRAIRRLVKDVVKAFTTRNGFDDVDTTLEKFARDISDYVLNGKRDTIVAEIQSVYDELDKRMRAEDIPAEVRDFLVGMARDLCLLAIPTVTGSGSLDYTIDSDEVVAVLVKHGVYNVVLRHYFIEEVNNGLCQALALAKTAQPPGKDRGDWEHSLSNAFDDYRGLVGDLQEQAWNALSTQDDIEEWANCLEGLVSLLDVISGPLDFFADLYPSLQDTADAVHEFIAVLDGVQILTRAIEFGLKVDCLDSFGKTAEPMYQAVFKSE